MNENNIEHWIVRVAAKLRHEYLTTDNYTTEKALSILSNCVGYTFLQNILLDNESAVKRQMDIIVISE